MNNESSERRVLSLLTFATICITGVTVYCQWEHYRLEELKIKSEVRLSELNNEARQLDCDILEKKVRLP